MRVRLLAALLLMPLVASCFLFGPGRVGNPTAYTECADDEGRLAFAEAKVLLSAGKDLLALPLLQTAVTRCPDLVRAHLAYQDLAQRLGGKDEQAMVDFYVQMLAKAEQAESAIIRSPVPAYLRARLTETAYAQSNALDEILKQQPSFAWAYLSRGRINRGQGRLGEALQNFEQAIASDSQLMEARLERAQVLTELGRDQEAAVEYGIYWRESPRDHVAAREYIALLLYRLGRTKEALQQIDILEQAGEKSLALRMDRAAALWRENLPQAAIEIYLEILAAQPATARAALNIGLLYYEIVPKDEADKLRFWPKARAAFELFLQGDEPSDGHEQFERTWAVPYRLRRIAELLGPSPGGATISNLRWPDK